MRPRSERSTLRARPEFPTTPPLIIGAPVCRSLKGDVPEMVNPSHRTSRYRARSVLYLVVVLLQGRWGDRGGKQFPRAPMTKTILDILNQTSLLGERAGMGRGGVRGETFDRELGGRRPEHQTRKIPGEGKAYIKQNRTGGL